ncbi:MAG: methyltransferase domain-containing protein [Ignavibacteria bacterium]
MNKFTETYWDEIYHSNSETWDIGYISTPIKEYIDQLNNKLIRILVPGAGNGYEVEYLYKKGFHNTYALDWSKEAIKNFSNRVPEFPKCNIIKEDFFAHRKRYDLIIEQTFFSSIEISNRYSYVKQMWNLLKSNGKVVGLLFDCDFGKPYPPFGGSKREYEKLFSPFFIIKIMDRCYNSIKPRLGRELFFILQKSNKYL